MNCHDAARLLPDYLEHELDSERETQVREHVATCRACQMDEARLRKTFSLLAAEAAPSPTIDGERFLADVKRRIRMQKRVTNPGLSVFTGWLRRPWARLAPVLAAAALLIVVGLTWQLHRNRPLPNGNDLLETLVATEDDTLDILSLGTAESLNSIDDQTVEALDTELARNTDLDDLIDDLSPEQQTLLVQELEHLYGPRKQNG